MSGEVRFTHIWPIKGHDASGMWSNNLSQLYVKSNNMSTISSHGILHPPLLYHLPNRTQTTRGQITSNLCSLFFSEHDDGRTVVLRILFPLSSPMYKHGGSCHHNPHQKTLNQIDFTAEMWVTEIEM